MGMFSPRHSFARQVGGAHKLEATAAGFGAAPMVPCTGTTHTPRKAAMKRIGKFVAVMEIATGETEREDVLLVQVDLDDWEGNAGLACEGEVEDCVGQPNRVLADDNMCADIGTFLVITDPATGDPDAGNIAHCLVCLYSEGMAVRALERRN